VVDRPGTPHRPDPVFAVGFAIDEKTARNRLRRLIASKRLAPAWLRQRAIEHLRGVYLPTYLYSAVADTAYDAAIGEDYTVVTVRNKKVRRETRTEIRRLRGRHACYITDVVVTASQSLANSEVEAIEPYDLRALCRYSPALISGWISEEPTLERERCLELAREESRARLADALRRFMPGDSCHELGHDTSFSEESIDLTLLPVWVAAIRERDDADPIRLLVNGQTGRAHGRIPTSWVKVGVWAAIAAGLVGLAAIIVRLLG
jgi:hypothetical protein